MDTPHFGSKDQEISHWKGLAEQYLKEKTDAQQELEDFTIESRQLERELEASLEQCENEIRELKLSNNNLQAELELSRNKLETVQKDYYSLEVHSNALESEKEKLLLYIRELEQKNDDLERAHRNVTESLAIFEDLLNKAYEKNALLESEVDEKDNLQVQLQRLRDEARDLKQELKVKVKDHDKSLTNGHNNSFLNSSMDSNRMYCDVESRTLNNQSPLNTPVKQPALNGNTLTSARRISALNIVGELLRKVGFGKLLCPACSRVTCTCEPKDIEGTQTNQTGTSNTTYKRLFIDGRYRPENLRVPEPRSNEEELNSMEFRLIQSTCALRTDDNDRSEEAEPRNGLETFNSFFKNMRSKSNNDLASMDRGQEVSARFQLWINNLVNKTSAKSEETN